MQVGDTNSWVRTFTVEDVERFGQLSGDQGEHHIRPDAQGRIMVQGLLTATLPTKLGGEMNFIARQMTFEFVRPVFVGDTIRCESRVEQVEQVERGLQMSITFACQNQHGKTVLIGSGFGIVRTTAL